MKTKEISDMENIEQYIQGNLEKFDCGEMPADHKDVFMKKIASIEEELINEEVGRIPHKSKRLFFNSRRVIIAICSAAAILLIALFANPPHRGE
ncbi:MAG: hypothetical protein IKY70_07095, partial [Bacteroidales bacterium]|nr:hypothetical protein [Bacteroidales bacterium]